MKKSELYHLAMVAIVQSPNISPENRVEIVKLLLENEDLELYREKVEAERNASL